ncbi:MAG: lysophospholipid acyltransferase family protein [Candidatus Tyrphobacter sp.]
MTLYGCAKVGIRAFSRVVWRVRVEGAQNVPAIGPLIVACNHLSLLDPPILGAYCPRPLRYMTKRELFEIPLFGPLIRAVGAYPVDREGSAFGAVKRSIEMLRAGEAIGIFPEGGRNPTGEARAREGVALLASLAKAPVVPAAIVGSDRALRLHAMKVVFGPALRLDGGRKATRDELAKFTATVMGEIRALAKRVNSEETPRA